MKYAINSFVPKHRESFEIEFDKLNLRPCTVLEAITSSSQIVYAVIQKVVYRLMHIPGKCVFVNIITMNIKDEGNPDIRLYLSQYADYLYLSDY